MMKRIIFFLFVFLQSVAFAHAQLTDVRVSKLSVISQLPVSSITCIFQDSEGYMWYGTVDGLCRDDGYHVHVFRSDYITPGLLDINSVYCIAEGNDHRIWFGTHKGLYVLDKQTYAISKVGVPGLRNDPVRRMLVRKNGDIWVACNNFVYELNAQGKLRKRHTLSSECMVLYESTSRQLFYSTLNGEFYCVDGKGKIKLLNRHLSVTGMCEDSKTGTYWLLTGSPDVWSYTPKSSSAASRFVKQRMPASFGSTRFRQVVQDPIYHYLWMLSWDYLYAFRPVGGGRLEQVSTQGLFTPEKKTVSNIYQAKDGDIWIASFDYFSSVVSFRRSDVINYSYQPLLDATSYIPAIVTLCKDEEGWLWYYQETNGLYMCHLENGGTSLSNPISYRQCPNVSGLPLDVVPYLVKSHQRNAVWVLTLPHTFFKLRREGSQMVLDRRVDLSSVSKTASNAEVIFEDRAQNLWIGTMEGVYKYDNARRRLYCISEKIGDVSDFCQSADGNIWCTVRNKGICRISQSHQWKLYPHEKDFLTLDIASDGTIWTSTGEGQILAFNPANMRSYKDYTLQAGFNGDMVDHVKVDRNDHLWLVTPQTIREFNPKNGAVRVYSTQDDDIVQYRFLPRAVFRDPSSGDMYFGGIPGLLSFKTGLHLESVQKDVQPRITDVKVMGKSIWMDPLRKKTKGSIEIEPDEQNLTIEFSSLDFRNHNRICYAYRLKGVDKDWVYLPVGKNAAIYNKVGKGDYVFEVKATDENGLWSKHIATFEIHRLPAWWETWWAYTIYFLLLIAALWQVVKRYKERVAKNNDQIIEENVVEGKKEYLTNVSKELVTPLMAIGTIAENMKAGDKTMEQKLGIIQDNVERLKGMVKYEMDSQLEATKIDERFIEKATKIVEEHLGSDKLDVVFLASELGMSRSTFSRKLKAVAKMTPLEFIRSIKMKHAALMLKQQTATIQDVMWTVGYNDHKSFSQVFRATYGMSPSEYQRENRE